MLKSDRHAVFMYTCACTCAVLAIFFGADAGRMRYANTELRVDAELLAMQVAILHRSFEGSKKENTDLRAEMVVVGKACGFKPPVRKPKKVAG